MAAIRIPLNGNLLTTAYEQKSAFKFLFNMYFFIYREKKTMASTKTAMVFLEKNVYKFAF